MEKNNILTAVSVSIVAVAGFLVFGAGSASADAWWGAGFRDKDWILEHGGSIIEYKIVGKEKSDDYKARMYLGERMVEIEYGGKAYFDDAINNTYSILIFKGSKVEGRATVSVKPGETVSLKFDLKKDKVEKSSTFIPKSSISLNSKSSKYVSPQDLRPAPAVAKPAPEPVLQKPETVETPVIETQAVELTPVPAVQEAVIAESDPDPEIVLGASIEVKEAGFLDLLKRRLFSSNM